MKKLISVALLAFMLTGCGEPKIDGSSDQALRESVQKVREALPEDKRTEFDDAIKVIAFQVSMKEMMQAGANSNTADVANKLKSSLSGKTGEEVIGEAEQIRANIKQRLNNNG
ncbi:hypothetical protein EGM70_13955 [Enterobacteriaceae bacterium 89]|nr:hypothetical protein [Enterobacteriaceae bacterium 89]